MTINGAEVADDTVYTVATSNFIAGGGDGITAFTKGEVVSMGEKVRLIRCYAIRHVCNLIFRL